MKPEYEIYRRRGEPFTPVSLKMPEGLKEQLDLIVSLEGDTITGIMIEGIARVIEDRRDDPEIQAKIQKRLEEQVRIAGLLKPLD